MTQQDVLILAGCLVNWICGFLIARSFYKSKYDQKEVELFIDASEDLAIENEKMLGYLILFLLQPESVNRKEVREFLEEIGELS